ncbi:hypothetical protein G6011_03625 [Alternaria panax]|uniref:BTB domain-containing protein n=1 Tax=Alternaria panax TaxID=48097 RepID=A0AAD4IFD7_9PLEO|nr:hypothetical protein G6011_03625 [Alternaria panax]
MSTRPSYHRLLINNFTLSNIKLKQIHKDTACEYFAHKTILCKKFNFFLKAFTGNFKEADESSIELHNDKPELFEFMLHYIYSDNYDKTAIDKLAAGDKSLRGLLAIGIYALADRCDIPKLYDPASKDLKMLLLDSASNQALISCVIRAVYQDFRLDTPIGRILIFVLLDEFINFAHTAGFRKMMLDLPILAADVAFYLHSKKQYSHLSEFTVVTCGSSCQANPAVDFVTLRSKGLIHQYCTCSKAVRAVPEF